MQVLFFYRNPVIDFYRIKKKTCSRETGSLFNKNSTKAKYNADNAFGEK